MRRFSSVFALFLLAVAPAIRAQESADTLPFRAHQWAFLFTGGSSFSGIGALHFTAPNRAWIFDLGLGANHQSNSTTAVPDTTFTTRSNYVAFNARIGRRFYQAARHDIVSFQTVGFLAGLSRQCVTNNFPGFPGGGSSCGTGVTAGFYGELGGQYFLTPRLSIGGQVTASLSGSYQHATGFGGPSNDWLVTVSAGSVSFGGGIYF